MSVPYPPSVGRGLALRSPNRQRAARAYTQGVDIDFQAFNKPAYYQVKEKRKTSVQKRNTTFHRRRIRNRGDILPRLALIRVLESDKSNAVSSCLCQKVTISASVEAV